MNAARALAAGGKRADSGTQDDGANGSGSEAFRLPPLPKTPRGIRTRTALVAAARQVFERAGFLDARLIDITTEAKCSAGTFYTYFESKEQIFAAVLEQAKRDMLHPGLPRVADSSDPIAVIEASTRAYLEAYRRNAKLMALLEQVAQVMPAFRRLRHERAQAFFKRNARSIADLQDRGLADAGIDADLAARALSWMVSRLAFTHYVEDPAFGAVRQVDLDTLVSTASRLWANALCLQSAGSGSAARNIPSQGVQHGD